MSRKELMKLWPRNASDNERAERLVALGPETLAPVLPDIIEWLKSGAEVRQVFGRFLASHDGLAVEFISKALTATHDERILFILRDVLPYWSKAAVQPLAFEIERLLQVGSVYGLHVHALALLNRHSLSTHAAIREWCELFQRRLDEQGAALHSIRVSLSNEPE